MQNLPNSRKVALLTGSKYYFTGKQCPKGHIASRYTMNSSCSICIKENSENWKKKGNNRQHANLTRKVWRYGITKEDYANLLEIQENKCAICRNEFTKTKHTHVDHCHTTGKVRGILCSSCNRGLGFFYDNIQSLKNAVNYLSKGDTGNEENDYSRDGIT